MHTTTTRASHNEVWPTCRFGAHRITAPSAGRAAGVALMRTTIGSGGEEPIFGDLRSSAAPHHASQSRRPQTRRARPIARRAEGFALLAAVAVLAAVLGAVFGQEWLGLLVYLSVAAAPTLPTGLALAGVVGPRSRRWRSSVGSIPWSCRRWCSGCCSSRCGG
jgi:hypothetical protein